MLCIRFDLNVVRIGSLSTDLPPISEQLIIAVYLAGKCPDLDKLHTDVEQEIDTLDQY